jgi:tripartite-type tricarboxylate transporter receptor subunit TctC
MPQTPPALPARHARRRTLAALGATGLAFLAAALGTTPAAAQSDWPAAGRTIRLIVPSPGGSGTGDTIARIFAEELAKRLKTTFVVDNKPGANGNVGATAAAQATGDGYNFLFSWAGTLAVNQAMYKQMGYDSQRDFLPIALLAEVPNILVVNNELAVRDLAQFNAYVKANPGKLSYGSTGIGSSMHLAGELYSREYGAQMVHVPFSNPGNATTNLISGELQLMFQLIPGIAAQVKAGRVRAIGVMAPQRSPALPDDGRARRAQADVHHLVRAARPQGNARPRHRAHERRGQRGDRRCCRAQAPDRHRREHPGRHAQATGRPPRRRDRQVGPHRQGRQHRGEVRRA